MNTLDSKEQHQLNKALDVVSGKVFKNYYIFMTYIESEHKCPDCKHFSGILDKTEQSKQIDIPFDLIIGEHNEINLAELEKILNEREKEKQSFYICKCYRLKKLIKAYIVNKSDDNILNGLYYQRHICYVRNMFKLHDIASELKKHQHSSSDEIVKCSECSSSFGKKARILNPDFFPNELFLEE